MKSVTSAIAAAFLRRRVCVTARASGCSLVFSSAYGVGSEARVPISRLQGSISVTLRFASGDGAGFIECDDLVSLPVSSSETAVLNRMPFFAPMPFPTMMATGVAKSQRTGTADDQHGNAACQRESRSACPQSSQTAVVTTAMVMTVGTNTPDTLSATFAIGAFVAAASLTILMICERVVSSPTRVASQRMKPD